MNVLFVYTNINGFHEDIYSFGLASIVSVTKRAGHAARVLVLNSPDQYSTVLEAVEEFKPRVVGFSSVSSQFSFVKELAAMVKQRSAETITVCGGVHTTINPQCLLEADALDGIFIGESELAFEDFLRVIDTGESFRHTDNFAYTEDGKLVKNKLKPLIGDLDILPYPDRDEYPLLESIEAIGYVPFLFSRGCPYLCSYCSNHAIAQAYGLKRNTPRYRSAESSIAEIERTIKLLPTRRVLIADDIFGIDKQWRRDFCKAYAQGIHLPMICLLRANVMDDEFMELLREAGCYRISIGLESGNDHVRNDIMNREMSTRQIERAFNLAHKHGIQTNAINLIGLPGEDDSMVWDTIRLNRKLKPTGSGVNIFYPYKGTKLGDYCFEQNMVDEQRYNSFSNERRESVLNFPPDYQKKLSYYHKNWEALVYPYDVKKRLRRLFMGTFIWKFLRAAKRMVVR